MGYLMLAVTAVLSVVVYRQWSKFIRLRMAEREVDYADFSTFELPFALIDFLPKRVRRIINPIVYGSILLLSLLAVGAAHAMVIRTAFPGGQVWEGGLFWSYLWSLAGWLVILSLLPCVIAMHRAARRTMAAAAAADSEAA